MSNLKIEVDAPKKQRGRPKMSEKEKAAAAAARAAATPREVKAKPGRPKKDKSAEAPKVTEALRVRIEDLTDDQHLCLFLSHKLKLSRIDGQLEKLKADRKGIIDLAKAELSSDFLKDVKISNLLSTAAGQSIFKANMVSSMRLARWEGLPVGHSDDLFATDRTPSVDKAFEEGKKAGMAGDDPKPPQSVGDAQAQFWMKGWHEGQAINAGLLAAMTAPKGRDLDEGAHVDVEGYLNRHYKAGYEACEAGVGCVIPSDLNASEGSEWNRGWADCADIIDRRGKPIDYDALGAEAFFANCEMKVPDSVPAHEAGHWRTGYQRAARKAHDEKQSVAA